MSNCYVIWAWISGISVAQILAERWNKVVLIEKRDHIWGNCYDFVNDKWIIIHKYGPHIFHTNSEVVWSYLNKFTNFTTYKHKVVGYVNNKYIPIPFNFNSIRLLFSHKRAKILEKTLLSFFWFNSRVSILDLLNESKKHNNMDLKFLADFIFEKIFKNYSEKQWGVKISDLDESILKRVPIVIWEDDWYFEDRYQWMPIDWYTKMFYNMLSSENISIILNTDYRKILKESSYDFLYVTSPIDEFFEYKHGTLDYRKTLYKFDNFDKKIHQPYPVINYPNTEVYTRITEMKWFYSESSSFNSCHTTTCTEYPGIGDIDAYPVHTEINTKVFDLYNDDAKKLKNTYFIGRLANYKYLNMDQAVKQVLDFFM